MQRSPLHKHLYNEAQFELKNIWCNLQPPLKGPIISHVIFISTWTWSCRCSNRLIFLSASDSDGQSSVFLTSETAADNTRSIWWVETCPEKNIQTGKIVLASLSVTGIRMLHCSRAVTMATISLWPAINSLISSKLHVKLEQTPTAECLFVGGSDTLSHQQELQINSWHVKAH